MEIGAIGKKGAADLLAFAAKSATLETRPRVAQAVAELDGEEGGSTEAYAPAAIETNILLLNSNVLFDKISEPRSLEYMTLTASTYSRLGVRHVPKQSYSTVVDHPVGRRHCVHRSDTSRPSALG